MITFSVSKLSCKADDILHVFFNSQGMPSGTEKRLRNHLATILKISVVTYEVGQRGKTWAVEQCADK